MAVSAGDEQAIARGLKSAKESNTNKFVVDGFFLAVWGAAAVTAAALGAGPLWLMGAKALMCKTGLDLVCDVFHRRSLAKAAVEFGQDPSGKKTKDRMGRLKSFTTKCLIAGAVVTGAAFVAPLAATATALVFGSGMTMLLAGAFAWDSRKAAEAAVKAVDAELHFASVPSPAPPAPAATPAPSNVAGLSAGPSFTAAANDEKGAAPATAPAAEKTARPFRTFDF